MNFKNVSTGTWIRTVSLAVSLISTLLVVLGYNPLPFTDEQITKGATIAAMVISSIAAWWKSNSFTTNGIKAKNYKKQLDAGLHSDQSNNVMNLKSVNEDDDTTYSTGDRMN